MDNSIIIIVRENWQKMTTNQRAIILFDMVDLNFSDIQVNNLIKMKFDDLPKSIVNALAKDFIQVGN